MARGYVHLSIYASRPPPTRTVVEHAQHELRQQHQRVALPFELRQQALLAEQPALLPLRGAL